MAKVKFTFSPSRLQAEQTQRIIEDNRQRQEAYKTITSAGDISSGVTRALEKYKPDIVSRVIDEVGLVTPEGTPVTGSEVVTSYQNYLKASEQQTEQPQPAATTDITTASVPGLGSLTFGQVQQAAEAQGKEVTLPRVDPVDEVELPGEREDILGTEDVIGDGDTETIPEAVEEATIVPGTMGLTAGEVEKAAEEQGKPVQFKLPEGVMPMYAVEKALEEGASRQEITRMFGEGVYQQAVSRVKKRAGQEMFVEPLKQKAGREMFVEPAVERYKEALADVERYETTSRLTAEALAPYTTENGIDLYNFASDSLKSGSSIPMISAELVGAGFDKDAVDEVLAAMPIQSSVRDDFFSDVTSTPNKVISLASLGRAGVPDYIDVSGISSAARAEIRKWNRKHDAIADRSRYERLSDNSRVINESTFNELSPAAQQAVMDIYLQYKMPHHRMGDWETLQYILPVYGTYKTISERGFGSGWSIASALGDALIFIPALKGAAAGARTWGLPGRAGRISSAARGAQESVVGFPSAEGIAGEVRSAADQIRLGYIPISGLEESSGTVRIPISAVGTPEEALAVQEALMYKYIMGDTPEVVYKGVTYRYNLPAISGRGVHTASGSEIFEPGAVVGYKVKDATGKISIVPYSDPIPPGSTLMPLTEQGQFLGVGVHSNFINKSAFGMTSESTPTAGIYGESASRSVSPGKTYAGTVEGERKNLPGFEQPPFQRGMYSRTPSGTKFNVVSEDEINLLKRIKTRLLSPYYSARSVFRPAVEIKGGPKVGTIDLIEEANRYEQAAQKAFSVGDDALGTRLMNEAASLRAERMARPMTAGIARTLAAEFINYAASMRDISGELTGNNRIVTQQAADRIEEAAQYLTELSRDAKLRNMYNNYVRLSNEEKSLLSRATEDQRREAGIPAEFSRIQEPNREEETRVPSTPSRRAVPLYETARTPRDITRMPLSRIPDRVPPVSRIPRAERLPDEYRGPATSEFPHISEKPSKLFPDMPQSQKKKLGIDDRGTIAWYQGQLGGREIWYVFKWPYKSKDDLTRYVGVTPPGVIRVLPGDNASYRSIQLIAGTPPDQRTIDLGIQDILISSPGVMGEVGTIRYTADIKRKTTSDVSVKGVKSLRTIRNGNPALSGVK